MIRNLLVAGVVSCVLAQAQIGGAPSSQQAPRAQQLPLSGRSQNGSVTPAQTPAGSAGGSNSVNTIDPSIEVQGAYQGSTPTGPVSAQPVALTVEDAIQRGIRYNLGSIGTGDYARQARAQRLAAAAQLLPDITGGVRETLQQINLAAQGFRISVPIAGFHFPTVVGPFNYFDARANFNETLSLTGLRNWRSSQENVRSAELSIKDSRELIALAARHTSGPDQRTHDRSE